MPKYKDENKQPIHKTYYEEADSTENAGKELSENINDYWSVDEWAGSEEVASVTEELIPGFTKKIIL